MAGRVVPALCIMRAGASRRHPPRSARDAGIGDPMSHLLARSATSRVAQCRPSDSSNNDIYTAPVVCFLCVLLMYILSYVLCLGLAV